MDFRDWDERYAASDLVWSAAPNAVVTEVVAPLRPGRALDVGAGEGRNAIWLADQGWSVLATDFSGVAIDRLRTLSLDRLGRRADRVGYAVWDATRPPPGEAAYDLVLFCYLHLPPDPWARALSVGVDAAVPGGLVLVLGHAKANLARGYGGPQDPEVLFDPEDVEALARTLPVEVERSELRTRVVETDDGPREAVDTLVLLRRV